MLRFSKGLFPFFIICFYATVSSAQVVVKLSLKDNISKQAFFCSIYGQKMNVLAAQKFNDDKVEFKFASSLPKGIYKIYVSDSSFSDIIIDRDKEIILSSNAASLNDSMKVLKGEDNRIYFTYLQYKNNELYNLNKIIGTIKPATLKKQNPLLDDRVNFIKGVETYKIQRFADSIIYKDSTLFVSKVIRALLIPNLNLWQIEHPEEKKYDNDVEFLLNHFFDNIDFSDTAFLRTEFFYRTISYYIEKLALPRNVLGFNVANQLILNRSKDNESVYKYTLSLLFDIYENTQLEDVFVKLYDDYLSKQKDAVTEEKYTSLTNKINIIKSLKAGTVAPDISGKDTLGKTIKLSSVKSTFTLIMFWTPSTKNVDETIMQFNDLYTKYMDYGFQIYAVCLDTSDIKWKAMLRKLKPQWINVIDTQGMTGPVAKLYNTWALPSLYMLDSKMAIAAKPMNVDYVKKEFETAFKK
jgi:peroxiredoxin